MIVEDYTDDTILNRKARTQVEGTTKPYVAVLTTEDDEWCVTEHDTLDELIESVCTDGDASGWYLRGICYNKMPQKYRLEKQMYIQLLGGVVE